MREDTPINIWKERSDKYNNIGWVTNEDLLKFIYESLQLNGNEKILDAGIGTGIMSKYIIEKSPDARMYGLDSSPDMIKYIGDERIVARVGDLKNMPFIDNLFDIVILRSVLHHCVGYTSNVVEEARRVLKPGGKIIVCEGIPINNECVSDFSQIVTLKENRLVFTPESFLQLLSKFKGISAGSIILKQQSIMNWIVNCVEDHMLQALILDRHNCTSDIYKKSANMQVTDKDTLVDMKFLVVRAYK